MKKLRFAWIIPAAGLLTLSGCKSTPQMTSRPDFLSTYDHLQKVETGVYRYVSPPLLANCSKFMIDPVKVLFTEYDGKPITDAQRQRSADFIRNTMAAEVGKWYPVVNEPGPDVGEIRVALTEAYKTGGKLGLCVQGEILDNSKTQVAAVVRTELSQRYGPEWEDKTAAREMVQAWAQRLLKAVDDSRRK
jgi:hypothetical protein